MNGIRMLSPGPSTALNLPSRSTTQACCCGTTFNAWVTNTTAMASTTRATTIPLDASIIVAASPVGVTGGGARATGRSVAGRGDDEPVADDAPDHVGTRPPAGSGRVGEFDLPGSAAVSCDGSVRLGPMLYLDSRANVENQVGGRILPGIAQSAPAPDERPAGDRACRRREQLQRERAAGQCDATGGRATEGQYQQVEGPREHLHDAQDQRRQPPCL